MRPRGFIGLPALLAIVVVLLAAGGGTAWYLGVKHDSCHNWLGEQIIMGCGDGPIAPPPGASLSIKGEDLAYADSTKTTDGPNVGCYFQKNGYVYWGTGPLSYRLVYGADLASFHDETVFGICLGRDAHHVYNGNQLFDYLDSSTYKLLWYSKPGPTLFVRNGKSIAALKYSDGPNYEKVLRGFGSVANSDAESFAEIPSGFDFNPWARDKNNLYCQGEIVPGADPSTAQPINQGVDLQVRIHGTLQTLPHGSCGSQAIASVPGMSQYTDSDFGFSFWYPTGWRVTKGHSGSAPDSEMELSIIAPPFDGSAVTMFLTEHAGDSAEFQPAIQIGPGKFIEGLSTKLDTTLLLKTVVQIGSSSPIEAIQAEKEAYSQ